MIAKATDSTFRSPAFLGGTFVVAAALAGCAVLFWFDPVKYPFYPTCLFHRLTGWNCPGCGSLRAMHALLHGHLGAALRDNVLLMAALPFLGFHFFRHLAFWSAGRPVALPAIRPRHILLAVAVMALFTVLRNIPAAPFTLLSPP
jgi:hypothetical protein